MLFRSVLGEKLGMTQVWDDAGRLVPVTVVQAGPCVVTQLRTAERDGYTAVQVAYGAIDPRKVRQQDGRLSPQVAHFHPRKILRLRTLIYFAAWSLVGLGLLYALLTRERLQVNVLADRNPQFVVLSDGSIRNGYTVKLLNMIPEPRTITVALEGLPGAEMSVVGMDQPPNRSFAVEVKPDRLRTIKVFVRQPRESVADITTWPPPLAAA